MKLITNQHKHLYCLLMFAICIALTSCGVRGQLTLPASNSQATSTPAANTSSPSL